MNDEKKPRLLITEDDTENQRFLEIFLKRKFEIDICDSDITFNKLIGEKQFDIILMDITLRGEKSGLEIIKDIRRTPHLKDIPILCLTAHAFQKDKESALKAGADLFLSKPVPNDILMNSLTKLLHKNDKVELA